MCNYYEWKSYVVSFKAVIIIFNAKRTVIYNGCRNLTRIKTDETQPAMILDGKIRFPHNIMG